MKKSPFAALSLALVLVAAAFAPALAAQDVTPFVSVLKGGSLKSSTTDRASG